MQQRCPYNHIVCFNQILSPLCSEICRLYIIVLCAHFFAQFCSAFFDKSICTPPVEGGGVFPRSIGGA